MWTITNGYSIYSNCGKFNFNTIIGLFSRCFLNDTFMCCRRTMAVSVCSQVPTIQFHFQYDSQQLIICSWCAGAMLMCFKLCFWPAARPLLRLTIVALAQALILASFLNLSDKPDSILAGEVISFPPTTTTYNTMQLDRSLAKTAN